MSGITTCSRCGGCYEAGSEEQANDAGLDDHRTLGQFGACLGLMLAGGRPPEAVTVALVCPRCGATLRVVPVRVSR